MSKIQDNSVQPRLQYNYAKINLTTGECVGCATFSYQINNAAYITVPRASDEYIGKFYNQSNGLWYYDAQFTQIFDTSSI